MAWLGATPQSTAATGQMATASQPFVWNGGRRMTPEDIAFQRRLAAQEMQGDYSPVQHWAQGLGRVLDGLSGGLRTRRLDRAAQANAAEADDVTKILLEGSQGGSEGAPITSGRTFDDEIAAALANPYLPDSVKNIAMKQWERANPKPQQPTDFQQTLIGAGIQPGSPEWIAQNLARANSQSDPEIVVPLPDGRTYVGPRSGLSEILKGGGPASSGPGAAPPPSTLPPDFDFKEPALTPTSAAPVLGSAIESGVISPAQAQAVRASLGPKGDAAFAAWLRNNNIRIAQ